MASADKYRRFLEETETELENFYRFGLSKPEVNGPVSVSYGEYEARIQKRISWLREQIAIADGGFTIYEESDT